MTGVSLITVTSSDSASICSVPLIVIVAPTSTRIDWMFRVLKPAILKVTWYSPEGSWVTR